MYGSQPLEANISQMHRTTLHFVTMLATLLTTALLIQPTIQVRYCLLREWNRGSKEAVTSKRHLKSALRVCR